MKRCASQVGRVIAVSAMLAVASAASAAELVIGNLLELTGPLSEGGPAMDKASRIAANVANQAATAAGVDMTVRMASADAQGDPQLALSAARTLVDKGAACITGPATTPESIAVVNGLTMAKHITLWPHATSTRLRTINDQGTIFRTVPADSLQSIALVAAIKDALGTAAGKTVSVAYRNEPYGEGLAKGFSQAWQAAGGKTQGPVSFDPNQTAFDSEAGQIVGGHPDAYVIVDYPDTYAKLGAALVRTGNFDPKKLFLPDAMAFSSVPKNIPPQAIEGARGVAAGVATTTDAYKLFDKLWNEAGGVEHFSLTPNIFDAALVCFLAAVEAKSTDPEAIQKNVRNVTSDGAPKFTLEKMADAVKAAHGGEKIDFVGVSGALHFAANGDPLSSFYDLFTYKDGKQVTVKQLDVTP